MNPAVILYEKLLVLEFGVLQRVSRGRNLSDIMCFTFVFVLMTVGCILHQEKKNKTTGCVCVSVTSAPLPRASSFSLQQHCTTSQSMMWDLSDACSLITY